MVHDRNTALRWQNGSVGSAVSCACDLVQPDSAKVDISAEIEFVCTKARNKSSKIEWRVDELMRPK